MAVQIARIEMGSLKVDFEAMGKILDKAGEHDPVAVIAVSGPLENGKSRIVKSLFNSLQAASSGPNDHALQMEMSEVAWNNKWVNRRPVNEILMWPEPLMVSHEGRRTAVLLMSVHGNPQGPSITASNASIFFFGLLLASVTIYHVKDELSEAMLQFLQMTIASAKAVSGQENACRHFGKLVFAINDWKFPHVYGFGCHDNRGSPSSNNFKKDKLDMLQGIIPENRVARQQVLSGFKDIGCFLMPNFDETVEVPSENLLQDMAKWIFGEGRVLKTMQNKPVSGIQLKALARNWTEQLTASRLSAFRTDMDMPGDLSIATALSTAQTFFRTEMTSAINVGRLTDVQLTEQGVSKKQAAIGLFERLTDMEESALGWYRNKLDIEFNAWDVDFLRMNTDPTPEPEEFLMVECTAIVQSQRPKNIRSESWKWFKLIGSLVFSIAILAFLIYLRHIQWEDRRNSKWEIPKYDQLEIPKYDQLEIPKYDQLEIPKYDQLEIPKFDQFDISKYKEFPKYDQFEIPKYEEFPKYEKEIQELNKYLSKLDSPLPPVRIVSDQSGTPPSPPADV